MTSNTEFTSPPSCQCERALVHYCQLHCWNLTFTGMWGVVKTIKVSRKNCVVSSFVSSGIIFVLDSVRCLYCNLGVGAGKQVQHNSTQLNTMHSCWSSRENKDWIKMLQWCRCHLSPETCFSGFRDKAFYLGGFLLIPSQIATAAEHKDSEKTMLKLLTKTMQIHVVFLKIKRRITRAKKKRSKGRI